MPGATLESLAEIIRGLTLVGYGYDAFMIGPMGQMGYGYGPSKVAAGYDRILEDEALFFDNKPIIGVRTWRVQLTEKGDFQLRSLYKDAPWPFREAHSALCDVVYHLNTREKRSDPKYYYVNPDNPTERLHGMYEHKAPDSPHDCGIYAYKSPKGIGLEWVGSKYGVRVSGEVYLWGKVLIHEDGYRAQYAYPKALWVPQEGLPEGVDYELEDLMRGLQAAYAFDWIPWPEEGEP